MATKRARIASELKNGVFLGVAEIQKTIARNVAFPGDETDTTD